MFGLFSVNLAVGEIEELKVDVALEDLLEQRQHENPQIIINTQQ